MSPRAGKRNVVEPAVLRRDEAAKFLAVSVTTIDRLVAAGEIRLVRIGPGCVRYPRADLDALIERSLTQGPNGG